VSAARRWSLHRLVSRAPEPAAPTGFGPARVQVVDIERPTPLTRGTTPAGTPYDEAWVLARSGGRPVGLVKVDLTNGPVSAERLGALLREQEPNGGPALTSGAAAVSVVIPTCRRPDDVERCVSSVLATGHPRLQVLVVDNAPDDPRTAQRIADVFGSEPRVEYHAEPVPGASRARNRGVHAATGDVVAFVDDDIVVDALWIAALTAAFDDDPDVSCVTGLVLPVAVDTPVHWWFEAYGGFDRGYARRRFDLDQHRGDTLLYPYTAGALGGLGNAAFRRDVLTGERPFDVTLGPGTPAFGAEDQDVLLRVLREGRTILYEPAAIVQHRHRDTYGELRWQVFTYGAGFVAALTHWAMHDRGIARDLLTRVPPLLPAALGRRPPAHVGPELAELPKELRRLGQLGYLYGPVAYARAVVARRRADALHGRPA
jgi:hypothetical protein